MSKRRLCDICNQEIGGRYYELKEHCWVFGKDYPDIHDICRDCVKELQKMREKVDE